MKQRQDIKSQIINASKAVFKRIGYTGISMDDIAKASGKGRSTLYHYFQNKEEVFEIWATSEFQKINQQAANETSPDRDLEENLRSYCEKKLTQVALLAGEYPKLLSDLKAHPMPLHKVKMQTEVIERKNIKQLLMWAVEHKQIQQRVENDLDYLALAIVTAMGSLFMEMILFGAVENPTSKLFWLINVLVKGLR